VGYDEEASIGSSLDDVQCFVTRSSASASERMRLCYWGFVEDMMSSARLYVGNLSYGTTKETLEKTFSEFGQVVSINIITDRQTGRPKGFAFVELSTPEEAEAAKQGMNGVELDGRSLNVDNAREQEPRRPGGFGGGRGGYGGSGGYGGGYGAGGGDSRW
jgi:hypothetical protein